MIIKYLNKYILKEIWIDTNNSKHKRIIFIKKI